ncbi:nuclear transport factor 2 family protein [Nannocystis bainbridge]|uniref:Nuclear transport factor 2 family protein n=1 Tax=Nannocystis bainbridge TaxID=2995303 RepID=A0ABT5E524_9BACT|nr:nuclear transport factor 2 family protein [Nannocystis bainbridge]MDC0720968.1 nuclear transport factor 2 family protein [Nannocystis bainbridge]
MNKLTDLADDEQKKRLKRLVSRTEIEALKAEYARKADAVFNHPGAASAAALADLFTVDGILDLGPFGRYEGRAQLLNACENILPQATRWTTHYIVSPILEVGDHAATGSWYFLIKSVPQSPPGAGVSETCGGYADKYVKTPGGWKIRESLSSFFVPPT